MEPEIVTAFSNLFTGGEQAIGNYDVERDSHITLRRRATLDDYESHLNGEVGLGLVPIRPDGTCLFLGIDIDINSINHSKLAAEVKRRKIPCTVCRSKSGGGHLYIFFKQPGISALKARQLARRIARALGFPDAEIFPKQEKVSETSVGNWINLPYFGGDRSSRYAVDETGALTLTQFLSTAVKHEPNEVFEFDEASEAADENPAPDRQQAIPGAPPDRVREGSRDTTLTSYLGRVRRLGFSERELLALGREFNQLRCEPPLPDREVVKIARSVARYSAAQAIREIKPIIFLPKVEFLIRASDNERPALVENLLPVKSQTLWNGRPKVGKSHTLLQLAFDLAHALPVFNRFRVVRPHRVVYLELEEDENETRRRLAAMEKAYGDRIQPAGALYLFSRDMAHEAGLFPHELLTDRFAEFAQRIKDVGAELVILIALRRLLRGNINDTEQAERLNDGLDLLMHETGAALAIGHHDRKTPGQTAEMQGFGSTMFSARVDGVFDITRTEDGTRQVRAECRYGVAEKFYLQRVELGGGLVIHAVDDPEEARLRRVLELLDQGATVRQVAGELRVSVGAAHGLIQEAKAYRDAIEPRGSSELFRRGNQERSHKEPM